LVDAALDVNYALLALGHEAFEAAGARFVRNRSIPSVWNANYVWGVTAEAEAEIDRLLARAAREYEGMDRLSFETDYRTPPEFEARLALEGYEESESLVMVLEGELRGAKPKPREIMLVESPEDWAAYGALHSMDWAEARGKMGLEADPHVEQQLVDGRRVKSPPVRYWLAHADGAPRAYLLSWEGPSGVGQVEDLFTQPEYRHQGLATALIHHCVADARVHGAGPVVIVADPSDTPMLMYAALGFRPVAVKRTWRSRK
jgi:GNAT superfamily N-acetyltransferase